MSIARFFLCNPNNEYFTGAFCLDMHDMVNRCSVVDLNDMVLQDVPVSDLIKVDVSQLSETPLMYGIPMKARIDFKPFGEFFRNGSYKDVMLGSTNVRLLKDKVILGYSGCFLRVNAITKCLEAVGAGGNVRLLSFSEQGYTLHFCFVYRLEGYMVLCYQLVRTDYGSKRYVTSVSAAYDIAKADFKGFWMYGRMNGIRVIAQNQLMQELQYEMYNRNMRVV